MKLAPLVMMSATEFGRSPALPLPPPLFLSRILVRADGEERPMALIEGEPVIILAAQSPRHEIRRDSIAERIQRRRHRARGEQPPRHHLY